MALVMVKINFIKLSVKYLLFSFMIKILFCARKIFLRQILHRIQFYF